MIDLHCHILPGLDDGAPDLDASLAMARMAAEDGVRVIVGTPHVPADGTAPPPALIRERAAQLQAAVTAAGLPLTILPGAECEADDTLAARAKSGEALTVGDRGQYLLVEMPFNGQTAFIEHVAFALQLVGITPIFAHPERSQLARERPETLVKLYERGCLLQVNAGSLQAHEGRAVRGVAQRLLRAGIVSFIGTDGHDTRRRPPLLSPCRGALRRFGGAEDFDCSTALNAERILKQTGGADS